MGGRRARRARDSGDFSDFSRAAVACVTNMCIRAIIRIARVVPGESRADIARSGAQKCLSRVRARAARRCARERA